MLGCAAGSVGRHRVSSRWAVRTSGVMAVSHETKDVHRRRRHLLAAAERSLAAAAGRDRRWSEWRKFSWGGIDRHHWGSRV